MKPGEETDEECWDDPIRLFDSDVTGGCFESNDQEQSYRTTNRLQFEGANNEEFCQAEEDDSSSAETEEIAETSPTNDGECGIRGSFVKLVDCGKFPWYYKKYTQRILKITTEKDDCGSDIDVISSDSDLDDCVIIEDNIPNKFKSIQAVSVFRTKIKLKTRVEKRRETMKRKEDLELRLALDHKNKDSIDLKRNTGLVGLRIACKVGQSKPPVVRNNNVVNKAKMREKKKEGTTDKKHIDAAENILRRGVGPQPYTTDKNIIEDHTVRNEKQATNQIIMSPITTPKKLLAQCRLDRISEHLLNKIKTMKNNNILLKAKIKQMVRNSSVVECNANILSTATHTTSIIKATEKDSQSNIDMAANSAATCSNSCDMPVSINSSSHVKDISKTNKFKNDQIKLQNNDEFNNVMQLISPNTTKDSTKTSKSTEERKTDVNDNKDTKKGEEIRNKVKAQKRNLNSPILPCRIFPKKTKESNDVTPDSCQSNVSLNACHKDNNIRSVVNKLMNTENLKIHYKSDHKKIDLSKQTAVVTKPPKQNIEENIVKNKINKKDCTVTQCIDTDFRKNNISKTYKPKPCRKQNLSTNNNEKIQQGNSHSNNVLLQYIPGVRYSETHKSSTASTKTTSTTKPAPETRKDANVSSLGKPVNSPSVTKPMADKINVVNDPTHNISSVQNRYASSIILKPNQQATLPVNAPNVGYSDTKIRSDTYCTTSSNMPIPVLTHDRNQNVYGYHQTDCSSRYTDYLSRSGLSGVQQGISQQAAAATEKHVIYKSMYSQSLRVPQPGHVSSSTSAARPEVVRHSSMTDVPPSLPSGPPPSTVYPTVTNAARPPTALAPTISDAVPSSKALIPPSAVARPPMPTTRPRINASRPYMPAARPPVSLPTSTTRSSMTTVLPPMTANRPSEPTAYHLNDNFRSPVSAARQKLVPAPTNGPHPSMNAAHPPMNAAHPPMNAAHQPTSAASAPMPVPPLNAAHSLMNVSRQPVPSFRHPIPGPRHSMTATNFRPLMPALRPSMNTVRLPKPVPSHSPMKNTQPAMHGAHAPTNVDHSSMPAAQPNMKTDHHPMNYSHPLTNVAHSPMSIVHPSTASSNPSIPGSSALIPVNSAHSAINITYTDFHPEPAPSLNFVRPPNPTARPAILGYRPLSQTVRAPSMPVRPPTVTMPSPSVATTVSSIPMLPSSFAVPPPRFPVPPPIFSKPPSILSARNAAELVPSLPPAGPSSTVPFNNNDLVNQHSLDGYRNLPVSTSLPVPPEIYSKLSPPTDSSIIGINNDGLVKKINIVSKPVPNTAEVVVKVEPVTSDAQIETSQNDAAVVQTKKEMMKELDRLSFSDEESNTPLDVLKHRKQKEALKNIVTESKNNVNRLFINVAQKKVDTKMEPSKGYSPSILPIPTYEKDQKETLKNTVTVNDNHVNKLQINAAQKNVDTKTKPSKGYSPPILPIPTYENVLDQVVAGSQMLHEKLISTLQKNVQGLKRDAAKKVEKGNKRKLSQVINRLEEGRKVDAKKISLEEYKKRGARNDNRTNNRNVKKINAKTKNDNSRRQAEVNKDYSTETDLGYDSDSTVVL